MNKQLLLLAIMLVSTFAFAQKATIKTRALTAQFEQPEFLKNVNTFSYTIQDDGTYWNYTPTNDFPTIASNTDGLKIAGLEQVETNGDLQIIVGFSGNQLKTGQGVLILNGSFYIQILDANNQLITTIEDSKDIQVGAGDPKKYPMGNRDERNITKARIVTDFVEKLVKQKEHILSGQADLEVPFGLFKKVKGGPAETFNVESSKHIEAIITNSNNVEKLDSSINYWTSQLDVDFGKKMKDKIKNKVIYANLASAQILKKDLDAAKKSMEKIKEYKGLFDTWPVKHKDMLMRFESIKDIQDDMITVDVTNNSTYLITLNDVKYARKDKIIACSKIEIMNFIPSKKSGIASLDALEKPSLFLYEDGVKTLRYFGDDKVTITTKDGENIVFKAHKGAYKPCVQKKDGSYRVYNNYAQVN